jgi:hypothetical protein
VKASLPRKIGPHALRHTWEQWEEALYRESKTQARGHG